MKMPYLVSSRFEVDILPLVGQGALHSDKESMVAV